MGQCFLYGNGGGKDRYRVKVFGGTSAPANPKESYIWIRTSVPVSGYEINGWTNALPGWQMGNGFVYIYGEPAYDENKVINLIEDKGNVLNFNFKMCTQQQGTNWYRMDAFVYRRGSWMQFSSIWDGELFDNGNQYTNITGGWTLSKFSLKDGAFDTGLTSETSGNDVMACTVNKIDVGQFSTLHIQCYSNFRNSGGPGNSRFGICSTNGPSYNDFAAYKDISTGSNNISYYSIDISSVTGTYYVKFYASVAYKSGWLKIEKMWLT